MATSYADIEEAAERLVQTQARYLFERGWAQDDRLAWVKELPGLGPVACELKIAVAVQMLQDRQTMVLGKT